MVLVKNGDLSWPFFRIDTGDDRRISKDEFTSDALKGILEKVTNNIKSYDDIYIMMKCLSVCVKQKMSTSELSARGAK